MANGESMSYFDREGLLTEEDIRFIHAVLGDSFVSLVELCEILEDAEMRQDILESRCLFNALLDNRQRMKVSEYFYYSTLVRQVLVEAGLPEPGYLDRVVSALMRMIEMQRIHLERHHGDSVRYFPVNLSVLRWQSSQGEALLIFSEIDPFQMVLEGVVKNSEAPTGVPSEKEAED